MTVLRPSRRPAGPRLAVAALAVCALSGCSLMSPQTTQNVTYAPSDGVQGEVGEVKVRNVLLLTREKGAPAEMVAALFNESGESVDLEVVVREATELDAPPTEPVATERLTLSAGENLSVGPEAEDAISIEDFDVLPGLTAEVAFLGAGGELVLQVPVLDGTLPEYAELIDGEPEEG